MTMTMPAAREHDADVALIEAVRQRDASAFQELVRSHDRWVRGVIFGVLADRDVVDDIAQQAWASVWRRIGELRDARRWRAWVYRLTRNAAIDEGRSRSRQRGVTGSTDPDQASAPSPTPAQQLLNAEQQQAVLEAIRSLPALYREPFVLRHLEDWPYARIAETMGIAADTVETRLVRARRLLREALAKKV